MEPVGGVEAGEGKEKKKVGIHTTLEQKPTISIPSSGNSDSI